MNKAKTIAVFIVCVISTVYSANANANETTEKDFSTPTDVVIEYSTEVEEPVTEVPEIKTETAVSTTATEETTVMSESTTKGTETTTTETESTTSETTTSTEETISTTTKATTKSTTASTTITKSTTTTAKRTTTTAVTTTTSTTATTESTAKVVYPKVECDIGCTGYAQIGDVCVTGNKAQWFESNEQTVYYNVTFLIENLSEDTPFEVDISDFSSDVYKDDENGLPYKYATGFGANPMYSDCDMTIAPDSYAYVKLNFNVPWETEYIEVKYETETFKIYFVDVL